MLFKIIFEPAAIVSVFALGTIINRRKASTPAEASDDIDEAIVTPDSESSTDSEDTVYKYGTVTESSVPKHRKAIHSRLLNYFPFLMEIWYWLLTYWIYQGLRAISARAIAGNEAIFHQAYIHATQILWLEHLLHIDVELSVQRFVLEKAPWLMSILARIYHSHIILGVVFLVYCYTFIPRWRYQNIRRTLAMENVIAFVIITAWRCMPPRLLPEEYGFIDVLHDGNNSGSDWTQNKFQLTIAAMPSLHFGNSLFVAFCLCRFSPHLILRLIAPLWPTAMLLTVVATANHFLLDAFVGACVLAAAWRWNRVILILLPIEDFLFRVLRLDKPEDPNDGNIETLQPLLGERE
ncbi:integral membrane protein [Paecilomyces variotii No. 5]|uniref:Integral membrane protein n=1 Tax=Byssochlamys spectabilis (strain No. 5 / NBRC 109023) TaxID=1356009 RepID=V5GFF6_BYSSN|nr:integral membrane protein [Paecilomyces variotii No. 5]